MQREQSPLLGLIRISRLEILEPSRSYKGCVSGRSLSRTYSFATKYCSWHDPEKYAIFDGNVVKALTAYRKQDQFTAFRQKDLRDYAKFIETLSAFKAYYGVQDVSVGDLDKFLWNIGARLTSR